MNCAVPACRLSLLVVLGLLDAACGSIPSTQPPAEQRPVSLPKAESVAITNATLIDVTTGARQAGMTVVSKAGQIMKSAGAFLSHAGPRRWTGTGRFLIPGLWDMHAHHQATGTESLDLYLANGVVGTRDMGSDLEFILGSETVSTAVSCPGPRSSPRAPFSTRLHRIGRSGAGWPTPRRPAGVDFIQVHERTPRDAYFAIAEEAAKLGLPFAGHVPASVTVEEAARSGIESIEHLANFRVFLECWGRSPIDQRGARLCSTHLLPKESGRRRR